MSPNLLTYLPHGVCLAWQPGLLTLHVVSNLVIALAYFSIPFALAVFARRRRDLEFKPVFVMFALFITACGVTHVMEVWVLWNPDYWLDGWTKAFTAAVSIATAAVLWPLLPKALALPSPAMLATANQELRLEMERRAQAQEALERSNAELRASLREHEAFAYTIAHDLRAPLRAVDGFANTLREEQGARLDADGRGLLERISASVRHQGALIDDLLAYSRIGRQALSLSRVDMEQLALSVADDLEPDYPDAVVEIGALPPTLADVGLMREALQNLLGNALKFSSRSAPPRVTISGHVEDGKAIYAVRDNGVGFDMAFAGKLFGLFERLHSVKDYPGTGVGLATVQRILQRHGGRVWAASSVGEGATFSFELPDPPRRGAAPK